MEAAAQAWEASEARISEREGALPQFPVQTDLSPAAEERARGRLHRLSRERDDMGPVNLRAEIEAETVGADIATIIRESEELGTAIAKLRGSIGHLNREGRERLSAIFQQVDRHFQALFSRMFGGGRAHLALVGSDDPLQAGLEIFAQPPGKKLTALSLLSGGEQALTALSLVFAVFRCNPAPLCVLDEVDAPLDDANVERFCDLLGDMAQETGTRFLVVTHHQVTMARMDRLYGVTMQERGVSRLLSVDLSRAVGMIEAGRGRIEPAVALTLLPPPGSKPAPTGRGADMTDGGGSFDERLRKAQERQENEKPQPARGSAEGASPMGIGARVGVELVAAMAVAVAIGWGLDRWLGTTPWLIGLFVLLGGAAGVANVWRLMMPRAPRKS